MTAAPHLVPARDHADTTTLRNLRSPRVNPDYLSGEPESHRAVDPGWRPTLPSADPSAFTLADLLAFAATVA